MGEKGLGRREPGAEINAIARAVVDCAFQVHAELGPGYGELVYENALCIELELRGIPYARQAEIAIHYRGRCVGEGRADLIVADGLVVELKSVPALAPVHKAQVLAYLKATGCDLGLLINFNVALFRSGVRRIVLTHSP
jgi:GxxExxY protein